MKNAYILNDTIAAIATPPGRGALGIVRLSGPSAVSAASSLIKLDSCPSVAACPPRKTCLGIFHRKNVPIDQVMVTLFPAPHSYTGEDVLEISCHGGPAILKQILEGCLEQSLRLAEPGEFSQRAFLNGKMDLAQAEAVADLIGAGTDAARAAALSQMQGGLSSEIRGVRGVLIEILAHLEVNLDHSDDATVGPAMLPAEIGSRLAECFQKIERLAQSYEYGRLLKEGWRIAIVGRPNVGKSSLLNALLKTERAIVTDIPGTTRDTLEEGFDLLGIPAVLVDTAGIREHSDAVEKIGIERARKAIDQADAVIFLMDSSAILTQGDREIASILKAKKKKITVLTKSDLPPKIDSNAARGLIPDSETHSISSLKGDGIDGLLKELRRLAVSENPVSDQDGGKFFDGSAALVTSLRHREALVLGLESLKRGQAVCKEKDMDECLALELREALDAMGEIIGETVTEDILKEIFSKFCIGK